MEFFSEEFKGGKNALKYFEIQLIYVTAIVLVVLEKNGYQVL